MPLLMVLVVGAIASLLGVPFWAFVLGALLCLFAAVAGDGH